MDTNAKQPEICPFCGLPIESWQEPAHVNGQQMHFDCYREKAGS